MIKDVNFKSGDIVRVYQRVKEIDSSAKGEKKEKVRTQIFQGIVLSIKGRGDNKSFIVRKTIEDVSVERIFPINSPSIEKVDVKGHVKQKIRRAKLNFLRKPR